MRIRPPSPALFRRRAAVLAGAALTAVAVWPGVPAGADTELRLNQIQVVGSHNSYHLEPSAREFALVSLFAGDQAGAWQYSHRPLGEQLAGQRVRQIELDLYADPDGGMYARPLIRTLTGQPAEYDPRMREPGTKVLHVAGLDYRSNCLKLVDCLAAVRDWSRADPGHVPVAILLEFKDSLPVGDLSIPLVTWTRDRILAVEQEIRSVFGAGDLITPDTVRDPGRTLEQSVREGGWPTLAESRGKVMFLMDNTGVHRDRYVEGNPSLEGRLMFTSSEPGRPDAAFVKRNDPAPAIRDLVAQGYLVRTRADADTLEARSGDTARRDAALASGAQWVSTDYPAPGMSARWGTDYHVSLPNGAAARCNPVTAPVTCTISTP
ncbi:phosphatidylinositol-specific phospholipase C1-like protein [Thermomonospora amylolytica]|uniref:phosphatidylinositol-specific phospholipase C1-like protein n=1 Tax=Thermomonospora amylolytica TaxID=1411117 RepID=UPI000E6BF8DB|nr:phosphatidylinositol-specific phospholipase C1-like protein [Thermomonospora amylolytica]